MVTLGMYRARGNVTINPILNKLIPEWLDVQIGLPGLWLLQSEDGAVEGLHRGAAAGLHRWAALGLPKVASWTGCR